MRTNIAPIVIATIEWSGGDVEPATFIANSVPDLTRALAAFLAPIAAKGDVGYVGPDWNDAHPTPDFTDADACSEWLDALREQTTDAWISIFTTPVPLGSDDATSETYYDVRITG